MYRWLIEPIAPELEKRQVNNLIFIADYGLRSVPMAVLHDGQKFLIEKYSIANTPSFSLLDTEFEGLQNSEVLAMGASIFADQEPLPAVPLELQTIAGNLWPGQIFLNQPFTVENLIQQRQRRTFGIVHLAIHADFNSGDANRSYIQFFDRQLPLDELPSLQLGQPRVNLLVISACQSAVGDRNAELGFAGLAVKTGVATTVASLWYVSDQGTLALMREFYARLRGAPIKAEALRQAQISLIHSSPAQLGDRNLSHPYYWAAFTMVGSPW